jgi:hypothetical protein
MLDTYVRLAGALSLTLDDLLAAVTWTPGEIEFEIDAGYKVEFEVEVLRPPECFDRNRGKRRWVDSSPRHAI